MAEDLGKSPFPVWNVVPLLDDEDDPRTQFRRPPGSLPIIVEPFIEHRRGVVPPAPSEKPIETVMANETGLIARTEDDASYQLNSNNAWTKVDTKDFRASVKKKYFKDFDVKIRSTAQTENRIWIATDNGLYSHWKLNNLTVRHESYGAGGPLATDIRDLATDSEGRLWVATPLGLSVLDVEETWRAVRGRQGLPFEDLTAVAVDAKDQLWIGSTRGLIHYRPKAEGRQWFYRAGERYLPNDNVVDVAVSADGRTIYTATEGGLGRLDLVETTLQEKAETIETVLNARHRRLGLVAACTLEDEYDPSTSWTVRDNDNDGLWTAYHVAAMSLAYAVTEDAAAKASARESMHSLYMLQNASGTPGLVARSVLPAEEARKIGKDKDPQWRLTPDSTMYWKSDTSADEIDGHYLAFYAYWEHVAKDDPAEREKCLKQVRDLTDYLIQNNYQLIDWDGQRTRWGFWTPDLLNDQPEHYIENGLNSLQILSFLKTAHYITGDAKYQEHYESLISDHHYLANVLLEKKLFPDLDNHSDNQLAYVAWYPILQTEQDPEVRTVLHKAVRRHYKCLSLDRSAFFYFVTATIDPDYVDLESAITNLKRIPTDRRQWAMINSHRTDIVFNPRVDRFGKRQLIEVLPVDERNFSRWNGNVYLADEGSSGKVEDDGAAYLLPYWMARYHGFIAAAP